MSLEKACRCLHHKQKREKGRQTTKEKVGLHEGGGREKKRESRKLTFSPMYCVAFSRFMSDTDKEGISTFMRRISPQGLGVLTVPTWRRRRRRKRRS